MKFLVVLSVLGIASVSLACRCLQRDIKTNFCSSDFTLRVKVLTDKQELDSDQYQVFYDTQVEFNYKADDRMKLAIISGKIYTSASSASCGRYMEKGHTYVITGRLNDGKLTTGSCDFGKTLDELDTQEKQFLDKEFSTYKCPQ